MVCLVFLIYPPYVPLVKVWKESFDCLPCGLVYLLCCTIMHKVDVHSLSKTGSKICYILK